LSATRVPLRSCVACRIKVDKGSLIRVVRASAGEIVIDMSARLSGRGAYMCWSLLCIEASLKSGKLFRSLRTDLSQNQFDSLRERLELLYRQNSGGSALKSGVI